jgi:hypothetical protein
MFWYDFKNKQQSFPYSDKRQISKRELAVKFEEREAAQMPRFQCM